jgi:predicted ATPase
LLEIGKAHVSPSWSAAATGLHGKLLFERGHTSEGIATLQAGIRELEARGSTLWQPAFCAWLAEAHAASGNVSQGLAAVKMGRQAAAGGAHWLDAELHRLEGELLQVGPLADLARTEAHFLEALAVARAQGSRTLELRTATSLARLWQSQGRAGEERALLAPVAWFTEGHDSTDLREAMALLRTFR